MSSLLQGEIEKAGKAIALSVTKEADAVRDLREFNERARASDPSKVAWPSTLPLELALKTASPKELKEHYGFTDEEWDALRENPVFVTDLAEKCDLVKQEGMSFKLKCQLQSEALLETNWKLIHAPTSEVPAASKVKLMEATWRMAGFDRKDGILPPGSGFAIQINFNGGAG